MATASNAELIIMCGQREMYQGKLGVIEEGAYADLLLVNGNQLKDISLLAAPDKNLSLIMKDGLIYKKKL
ncbi:hypothetical protein EC396_04545 [Lutibacter sp. HS1-25]|uniref:hypothetical protein n=1 Tax=Lutibacter sp. HS1-25 TaxID=2485000 RepID=UPI0010113143|nr:hypothetical protein [Lutibacter sp. HS1-25]RXP60928.1 hypothetical protein EC396_04545 [Lutibacter sp. HS1-25]